MRILWYFPYVKMTYLSRPYKTRTFSYREVKNFITLLWCQKIVTIFLTHFFLKQREKRK